MATQRFAFRPGSHAHTAPAVVRITSDYELANDRELASSQPVSLIQLCTKAGPSRSKATRRARALHSGIADSMAETQGVSTLLGVDKHEHFSRYPLPSYSDPAEYIPSDRFGRLAPPPRIVSQEYPWQRDGSHAENVQEQTWHRSLSDYHTQQNPLNYASHYNGSQSRESNYISESPFLRKSDLGGLSRSERAPGPADMAPPVTKQTSMDMPQSNIYTQKARRKEYMPVSSLQLYRDSFDRPHDRSPYESFRFKHRNNRTDLPEITSGLQYGFPSDLGYGDTTGNTTIRSEPNPGMHTRERLSNFELATYPREIRNKSQDTPAPDSRLSSGTSLSQRTLKEEIYAILDNMNIGSKTDPKPASTQNREGIEREPASAHDEERMALLLQASASESQGVTQGEALARCQHVVNVADPLYTEPVQSNIEPSMQADRGLGNYSQTSDTPPERIIKPPPGLSESEIPSLFKKAEARLLDADRWFHQDARKGEQWRQYIANVAESFVDRIERLGGQTHSEQDRVFTRQTFSVLGDAVVNFHTYRRGEQGQYFADYKPVASRYCELSSEGQPSYYDDTWGRRMEETALDRNSDFN